MSLADMPVWALFVWLSLVFTTGLFLGLPRRARRPLGRAARTSLRVGSTAALVLALLTVSGRNVLLPTLLALAAGVLSARSVETPRR